MAFPVGLTRSLASSLLRIRSSTSRRVCWLRASPNFKDGKFSLPYQLGVIHCCRCLAEFFTKFLFCLLEVDDTPVVSKPVVDEPSSDVVVGNTSLGRSNLIRQTLEDREFSNPHLFCFHLQRLQMVSLLGKVVVGSPGRSGRSLGCDVVDRCCPDGCCRSPDGCNGSGTATRRSNCNISNQKMKNVMAATVTHLTLVCCLVDFLLARPIRAWAAHGLLRQIAVGEIRLS